MISAEGVAGLMRAKRERIDKDDKYVLMLGAGASLGSKVPTTAQMMDELVARYGDPAWVGSTSQKFDRLWQRSSEEDRNAFLATYLKREPSVGYFRIAELVKAGYFDLILTFNFDTLLEMALQHIGFDAERLEILARGDCHDDEMLGRVEANDGKVKIVKLHGSVSTNRLLFDAAEMHKYPDPLDRLMKKIASRDIIICGYAFMDGCVIKSFPDQGGHVVSVNPAGPSTYLLGCMRERKSDDYDSREKFDDFFESLHAALHAQPTAREPDADGTRASAANPFKFLESYGVDDAHTFTNRDREIEDFFRCLKRAHTPHAIVLTGPSRVGKTSLVRAGLLSRLGPYEDRQPYGVYVRAHMPTGLNVLGKPAPTLLETLPRDLAALRDTADQPGPGMVPEGVDAATALRHLSVTRDGRRVVLFIDQFERVTSLFPRTHEGEDELRRYLQPIFPSTGDDRLTIVFVLSDQEGAHTLRKLYEHDDLLVSTVPCVPLSRREVVDLIRNLASDAGVVFEPRIIEEVAEEYDKRRFTLAHVHAVCHLLAQSRYVSYDSYSGILQSPVTEELDEAINVGEYPSFAEDRSWPVCAWLRSMVKVPLRANHRQLRISWYIMNNYDEVVPPAVRGRG